MERNITVEKINQTKTSAREVEIVERKGIGHPDSVADGIAEAVSRRSASTTSSTMGGYCTTTPTRWRWLVARQHPSSEAEWCLSHIHPALRQGNNKGQ